MQYGMETDDSACTRRKPVGRAGCMMTTVPKDAWLKPTTLPTAVETAWLARAEALQSVRVFHGAPQTARLQSTSN
jgi:hypothetical protein